MKSVDKTTIETYDRSAEELAKYFAGIGSRIDIIEKGLDLSGKKDNAKVVEVGCGDGRDAVDIVKRVKWYEGFDPSIGLIELARDRLPDVSFVKADALSYIYPQNLDAIFAFASFLHLDKKDFGLAAKRAAESLRSGGVLVMTLKEHEKYKEELVEDEFGKRMFYYYDEVTVRNIVDNDFDVILIEHQLLRRKTAKWLVVYLKKKP